MRLKKQLNIDNTNRSINFNQINIIDKLFIKVNKANKDEVMSAINTDQGKGSYFLIEHNKNEDLDLNNLVYRSMGVIYYYTKDVIPISALLSMGTNSNLYLVYEYTGEFNRSQIINIKTAFELSTVYIYLPYIDVNSDPRKYLFDLFDVRYIADAVIYNFKAKPFFDSDKYIHLDSYYTANPEIQKHYFDMSHEILARWKLQMTFISNNNKEEKLIKNYILAGRYY